VPKTRSEFVSLSIAGPDADSRRKPRSMKLLIKRIPVLTVALSLSSLVAAQSERAFQERLCAGMQIEEGLPSGGRVDCLNHEYAIEVYFSGKWHQANGQSLYYAAEAKRKHASTSPGSQTGARMKQPPVFSNLVILRWRTASVLAPLCASTVPRWPL
jgi:hypothetical protein